MTGAKSKFTPDMSMDSMGPSSLGPAVWVVITPDGFQKTFDTESEALAAADILPGSIASEAYPEDAAHHHRTHADARAEA